jgi:hypothetical protein
MENVPPSITIIDRTRTSGWGKGFPASFFVSDETVIPDVASFLMRVAYPLAAPEDEPQTELQFDDEDMEADVGGGFGEPVDNKLVEIAAIEAAKRQYESNGWSVHSVEREKLGFDLECRKNSVIECVEVKGVQGDQQSFIITYGEVEQARTNPRFVLVVVTSALSPTPVLTKFTGEEFVKRFRLSVLQYRAVLHG